MRALAALVLLASLGAACDGEPASPGLYRRKLASGDYTILPWRSFRGSDDRGWVLALRDARDRRGRLAIVSEDAREICTTDVEVTGAWTLAILDGDDLRPIRYVLDDRGSISFADEACARTGPSLAGVVGIDEFVSDGRLLLAAIDADGAGYVLDPWGDETAVRRLAEDIDVGFLAARPTLVPTGTNRLAIDEPGLPLVWVRTRGEVRLLDLETGAVVRTLGRGVRRLLEWGDGGIVFDDDDGVWLLRARDAEAMLYEPGGCEASGVPGAPGGAGYLVLSPCDARTLVRVRGETRTEVAADVQRFWTGAACSGRPWTYFTRTDAAGESTTWGVAPDEAPVPIPLGTFGVVRAGPPCLVHTSDRRLGFLDDDFTLTPLVENVAARFDLEAGTGSILVQHAWTGSTLTLSQLDPASGAVTQLATGVRGPIQTVGADFDVTGTGFVRDWDDTRGGGTLEARLFVLRGDVHETSVVLELDEPVTDFTLTLGFHLYGILYTVASGERQGLWLAAE